MCLVRIDRIFKLIIQLISILSTRWQQLNKMSNMIFISSLAWSGYLTQDVFICPSFICPHIYLYFCPFFFCSFVLYVCSSAYPFHYLSFEFIMPFSLSGSMKVDAVVYVCEISVGYSDSRAEGLSLVTFLQLY